MAPSGSAGVGGTATGGWPRAPEIVAGPGLSFPKAVGQPNGDTVYYWWMRGLPAGTQAAGASIPGAEVYVLAVDAWRFDPSYSLVDDQISYQRPDGTFARKYGSRSKRRRPVSSDEVVSRLGR